MIWLCHFSELLALLLVKKGSHTARKESKYHFDVNNEKERFSINWDLFGVAFDG